MHQKEMEPGVKAGFLKGRLKIVMKGTEGVAR
jgi:hypothetical protein